MPKSTKRERQRQNREYRRQAMHEAEQRRKRARLVRNVAIVVVPLVILVAIGAVLAGGDDDDSAAPSTSNGSTATIETSKGTIVVSLDEADAPKSVAHFVELARDGFYDGQLFNRVSKDFVIQTGSPDNTTAGGSGSSIVGEVPEPEDGEPAYPVGTVAFAKAGTEPAGTADSQFFIVTGGGNLGLPADYALIGRVTSGLDVAQAIGELYPASGDGAPTEEVTMEKVTIK